MTFVAKVREELCRVETLTPGEAAYELYGAALACGGVIATRHTAAARRFLSLARKYPERFGEANMLRDEDGRFGAGAVYRIEIDQPPRDLPEPETSEHAAAMVRGAFLCRGAVSSPESRCQANIVAADETAAGQIAAAMEALEAGPGVSSVRGKYSLYIRTGDKIAELLGRMGASGAYMEMESERVMKEMRSGVNRQVNCDHANIAKQQRASENQIAAIELIQNRLGLDKLPGALQEIAALRLDHVDASLEELGALCDPPSGKSGVNSRFRRLMAIAAKLG